MLTAFSDAHGLLPGPSPAPPTTRQRLRPAESWRAAPDRRMAPAPELSSAIQERRLPTLSAGPRPALAAQANSSPGRLLTELTLTLPSATGVRTPMIGRVLARPRTGGRGSAHGTIASEWITRRQERFGAINPRCARQR